MSRDNVRKAKHFVCDVRFMKHFIKRKTQMNLLLMESQSAYPKKLQEH